MCIEDVELSFTGSAFWNVGLYFDFTKFGETDLYFDKINFYGQDSSIHFIGTDFGTGGELLFSYMSGLKGIVEFYRCAFGENMLDLFFLLVMSVSGSPITGFHRGSIARKERGHTYGSYEYAYKGAW